MTGNKFTARLKCKEYMLINLKATASTQSNASDTPAVPSTEQLPDKASSAVIPNPSSSHYLSSKDLSETEHDSVDERQDKVDTQYSQDPSDGKMTRHGEKGKGERGGCNRGERFSCRLGFGRARSGNFYEVV